MRKLLFIVILFFSVVGHSQKKSLQTKFTSENIVIDGRFDESIWQSCPIATNFVMYRPDNGKAIAENKRTEVKIAFDNDAIYVAALLYDDEPSKILKEITKRDVFGTSDLFGVFINGNNDGQQNFQFIVSASDGQADSVTTDASGDDYSWDAIWKSKAIITAFGWAVEMRIPYAALRFSDENKQTWGLNFWREIQRDRQQYSWNFIDSTIGTFTQQNGTLEGIENIKPPTRLFLLPYSSFYTNASKGQKTYGTLKGGLDLKYGINDAFTLDMILIPDFGQTKYDNQILNLGPFEQQFNENRAFFTEGTDLFSKGNLVYSRRIGGSPSRSPKVTTNEEVIDNPSSVNLINAFKVSGRTKGGLGIGILNAVTERTYAIIQNTDSKATRREELEPLSNYSVMVLDQRFRKNSSISFVNTNVTRNGNFRDGNVSALVWDLNTLKNTYNLSGNIKYSFINELADKKGTATSFSLSETSGKYRFNLSTEMVSKNFDNNDLGINFETNYYTLFGNASYRILNPTKYFNTFQTNINVYTQFQKETGKIQANNINLDISTNNKQNHYFGLQINASPLESFDYYEPRTENRFLIFPSKYGGSFYFSSNYNNKFAVDIRPSVTILSEPGRNSFGFYFSPRYRFNDKFSLIYNFDFSRRNNNKGYIETIDDDLNSATPATILFANRNVITYSNSLSGKYSINSRMTFNLAVRHYWSYAENKNFLSLEQNGRLADYTSYNSNKNSSFNSWNADLSYSWWFAPGSEISVLYRNNAANFQREINKDFGEKLTSLLTNEQLKHVFSISIRYFIDYNSVKSKF
ncbi:DUF5916 domain-containing protein [Flavobacterium sp. W22_SRS_FP1]|uniref:DUF5916 domain-containing protein n=1 Tax=Flavobacterium sp. W22_SRS_FP1 TaxID=3240276 RepID=UPI003F939665